MTALKCYRGLRDFLMIIAVKVLLVASNYGLTAVVNAYYNLIVTFYVCSSKSVLLRSRSFRFEPKAARFSVQPLWGG